MHITEARSNQAAVLFEAVHTLACKLTYRDLLPEKHDIAQNALVKIMVGRCVPRIISNEWLFVTVLNAVRDAARRYARESMYLERGASVDATGAVCEGGEEEAYQHGYAQARPPADVELDLMPRLRKVFAGLSKPLRQSMLLYAHGYSYEQIAEFMHVKLGTVRSRIHYAKKRAQAELADYR